VTWQPGVLQPWWRSPPPSGLKPCCGYPLYIITLTITPSPRVRGSALWVLSLHKWTLCHQLRSQMPESTTQTISWDTRQICINACKEYWQLSVHYGHNHILHYTLPEINTHGTLGAGQIPVYTWLFRLQYSFMVLGMVYVHRLTLTFHRNVTVNPQTCMV
jgi:hypothetical protein